MPEQAKELGKEVMPKDLPMPKYEYQKPSSESYTYSYSQEHETHEADSGKSDVCLQNVKLEI